MLAYIDVTYNWKNLGILLLTAFMLRAVVFGLCIQHEGRYRQPDSFDYHYGAVGITHGRGMVKLDTNRPLFWRTPGYPYFLSYFFTKQPTAQFEAYRREHKTALWFQLFLCSFIPIVVFFLALMLTQTNGIAWLTAYITALHPGFILASGYLLTDALAHLLFTVFLLFFYRAFRFWYEQEKRTFKDMLIMLICAGLFLGLYTWFRPIGRYFMVISCSIIALAACNIKDKVIKIILLFSLVSAVIAPWYIRNYHATGNYFYCPMSGPYLQTFVAPKIIRQLTGKPLLECIQKLLRESQIELQKQQAQHNLTNPDKVYPQEFACYTIARPWCINYPFYFTLEWLREALKTTFDLYTTQLVAYMNNTYYYDPPEEFLAEKLADALYNNRMYWYLRILVWLELLFMLFIWIGLLWGAYRYILLPASKYIQTKELSTHTGRMLSLWIKTGLFIGGMLIMTGGFGYARLRMPIDPLMFILSLTLWYDVWKSYTRRGEKNL